MISKLTEGVYRCGSDRVNWYLVEGDNALTVIDTGFPTHWQQLLQRLDGMGYDRTDIEAGLLILSAVSTWRYSAFRGAEFFRNITADSITHAHPDHIGFAELLFRVTSESSEWHCL